MLHQKHLTNLKHSNIFLPASNITLSLIAITLLSGIILSSNSTSADVVDDVTVTVPVSCNMTSELDTAHTATINPGQYQSNIGITNFTVFCNDNSGYAIYAIGYSNEEYGNTKMLATINNALDSTYDINTGTNTSGANSSWAMKLIPVTTASSGTTQPYTPTIESDTNGSFTNYHFVPGTYTKVATFTSNTDFTIGSSLQSTYQAYIASTQPAGTYEGKVKYTLVHPNDAHAPVAFPATLDTGQTVNSKLKSLAATVINNEETTVAYDANDNYIKSIVVHLETPAPVGFIPTEKNTISTSASKIPVYIVFDNTDDAGIIHFYTEGYQIILPPDSSYMFSNLRQLTEISGISDWDTSSVTNMFSMFNYAGYNATTFSLDLSSWNTSNVTSMSSMFQDAGQYATTWSIDGLSSWDTSSVLNMSNMFGLAGYSATTFSLDLSSWNTASVTSMSDMFNSAGRRATTWSIGDLSSWNTSSVMNMSYMFYDAGRNATTWSIGDLSFWNTSSVMNMSYMFYHAGHSSTTFTLNLSSWDTHSVTNMGAMFYGAGRNATTWSVGDLSSWNTIKVTSMSEMFYESGYSAATFTLNLSSWKTYRVTNMYNMFYNAGRNATTWSITIPQTNGAGISNTTSRIYGKSTSTYCAPPSNKSFTLAQP